MRILITLLALCMWVFADVPNGSVVTQTVTINSAYVSETTTDFLLQFKVPRTDGILANCTSAANVAMTNLNDTLRRARWIVYTPDTLYIYAHTAKSTSANTVYRLHYGLTLNEVNSSSAFTNCGIESAVGFDINSGSNTQDYVTGNTIVNNGNYVPGLFSNAAKVNGTQTITGFPRLGGKTTFTYSASMKHTNISATQICFSDRATASINGIQLAVTGGTFRIQFISSPMTEAYCNLPYGVDTPFDVSVVYNGNGASNSDKLKVYFNGAAATLTFVLNVPNSINNLNGATTQYGVPGAIVNALRGEVDNHIVYSSPQNNNTITDRYRTLFTSTFWTLGTPEPVIIPDTIILTCTATGYDSLRWFHNGVATDSTGLTYTILADSAWYASKQVYYVIAYNVGGATKSGEWVFNVPDDTIILTCTASGYDSLRWFHNGIPTDSTGLTYTIYADSAWYASKSVYYVMAYNVGGATKSDEWVFGTSSIGSRRSGYRQINMGQGMH